MLDRKVGESSTMKRAIIPFFEKIDEGYREVTGDFIPEHAATYRDVAPTNVHAAHDCFDAQQAVVDPARGMTDPSWQPWLLPQRLESYARQRPQSEFQKMSETIVTEVDSDLESESGQKSVDVDFKFMGSHLADDWSDQQGDRVSINIEEELKGIWPKSVTTEMVLETTQRAVPDGSGTEDIGSRLGCGDASHLVTEYLRVKEKVKDAYSRTRSSPQCVDGTRERARLP